MLKEILEKTDDELVTLGEQYRKYYNSHPENFKTEYGNYFGTTSKNISLIVLDYIKIYQIFGYKDGPISAFVRSSLTSFYLLNISDFIKKRKNLQYIHSLIFFIVIPYF